jgi:hypothetical protein
VGALDAVGGTVGTGAPQSGSHADDEGDGSGTASEADGHPVTRPSKPSAETAMSGKKRYEVMVDEIPLSLRAIGGTSSKHSGFPIGALHRVGRRRARTKGQRL